MNQHAPGCRWPHGRPCLRFSTDGTLPGAEIAHTMGTTDEEQIKNHDEFGENSRSKELTGMPAEQADWESDLWLAQ